MKKEVRVTVFKDVPCIDVLCGTPQEVLDWWNDKFELIPEEYKDTIQVDSDIIISHGEYARLEIEIYYYRLETDEEYSSRINRTIVKNQLIRDRELELYKELKTKYGNINE